MCQKFVFIVLHIHKMPFGLNGFSRRIHFGWKFIFLRMSWCVFATATLSKEINHTRIVFEKKKTSWVTTKVFGFMCSKKSWNLLLKTCVNVPKVVKYAHKKLCVPKSIN